MCSRRYITLLPRNSSRRHGREIPVVRQPVYLLGYRHHMHGVHLLLLVGAVASVPSPPPANISQYYSYDTFGALPFLLRSLYELLLLSQV